MTNINKHPAGSFCWIELHTTDQPAAKGFYGSLFGWEPQDMPMGPNDFYTIFKLQGRDAAAGCTLRPEELTVLKRCLRRVYANMKSRTAPSDVALPRRHRVSRTQAAAAE